MTKTVHYDARSITMNQAKLHAVRKSAGNTNRTGEYSTSQAKIINGVIRARAVGESEWTAANIEGRDICSVIDS